jgi:hypothetical protein
LDNAKQGLREQTIMLDSTNKINNLSADFNIKINTLKADLADKLRSIEAERARIHFSVNNDSSTIDVKNLFAREEEVGSDYKIFRKAGFAVPTKTIGNNWTWIEESEYDVITETMGTSSAMADAGIDELREVAQHSIVEALQSPDTTDVIIHNQPVKLRVRCVFEVVDKKDLDKVSSIINHSAVKSLFAAVDKMGQTDVNLANLFTLTIEKDLLPLSKVYDPESEGARLAKEIDADFLGESLTVIDKGRVNDLMQAIREKVGEDRANIIQQGIDKKLLELNKDKPISDTKITPVENTMDFYYGQIFTAAYQSGDNPVVDEINLNRDWFVIKGHGDAKTTEGRSIRVFSLKVVIKLGDKLYSVGYMIPANEDASGVRAALSVISGFRIIK